MATFLLMFTITFLIVSSAALIINFSKQRANRTNHGLTGLCHKSGGTMCSSCGSQLTSETPSPTQE